MEFNLRGYLKIPVSATAVNDVVEQQQGTENVCTLSRKANGIFEPAEFLNETRAVSKHKEDFLRTYCN
jgi:hypothetical protein